jgi:hypothetical protein
MQNSCIIIEPLSSMIEDNKNKWLNYKLIGDLILKNCDGYIFGGFVRDSILHNHYATLYYQKHSLIEGNEIILNNPTIALNKYTDLEYYPEYKNRILIPSDIDVYLPNNNINELINLLIENNYKIISKKIRHGRHYFLNFDDNIAENLTHHILYIKPSFNKIYNLLYRLILDIKEITNVLKKINKNLFIIKLDIFTSNVKYDDPFFGKIDFECNGLYLTKHGLSISNKLTNNLSFLDKNNKLQLVINDIINNKAKWVQPLDIKRIYKMVLKEWIIINNKIEIIHSSSDDICLICQDNINLIDCKMKCCNSYFHIKCFLEFDAINNKNKCIHCNQEYI